MAHLQELAGKILRDLAERPVGWEKLAAEEAEACRDDPWAWYCRACASTGTEAGRDTRDTAATTHLATASCGRHPVTGWSEAGHLLHVWTYPQSACAQFN